MMRAKLYLVALFVALVFSSCTKLVYSVYGMKGEPKALKSAEIKCFADKYQVPPDDSFELDTSYAAFLRSLPEPDELFADYSPRKNHYQLLQALYYDSTGQLRRFLVTCYVGGLPNLKWNRDHQLETFLPSSKYAAFSRSQAPADTVLPLQKHMQYLKTLPEAKAIRPDDNAYTVVVYWSYFMGRQSKRLIRAIKTNVALAEGKRVRIVYVNTDNFFAGFRR